MKKRKKTVAPKARTNKGELVAKIRTLRKQHRLLVLFIEKLINAGDNMREKLCEPEVSDYTEVVYEWDWAKKNADNPAV